jgi:FMN phosphatase YigB (HAD superfamily)/membrane-associated phospholipid phosphatase
MDDRANERAGARPAHHHVVAIAVIVAVFAVLAVLVAFGAGGGLDWKIYDAIVSHRRYRLDGFFTPFTNLGSWYILAPVAIVLTAAFAVARRWREAALLALAPACALALNIVLKLIVHRAPPGGDDDDLVAHARYSFPSGHTMTTAALAAALVFIAWPTRWRWPVTAGAVVWAGMMGFSRVYVGVHWPSDVIAGWMMGTAVAWVVWLVLRPRAASSGRAVRVVLFDWGNTLMVDDGQPGRMLDRPHVEAVPGAADALAALRGHYRLYVATNADLSGEADVLAALERVELARFVDGVFSSHDIGARKPEAAFYAAALAALRADAGARGEPPLRAGEVVMVGDNFANDVAGALAAGLRAIWFNAGGLDRPKYDWPAGGRPAPDGRSAPDAEIRSLDELSSALSRL